MWVFDRIYIYSYALLLKTSSRKSAHDSAAIAIGFVLNLHLVGTFSVLSVLTHRDLILLPGRIGDGAIGVLIVWVFGYIYLIRGRGNHLLKKFADKLALKRSFWVGLAIALWSFCFPIICIGYLILFFPAR